MIYEIIHFIPFLVPILGLGIIIYNKYSTINYYITLFGYFKITDKNHNIKDGTCINCKSKFEPFKISPCYGLDYFEKSISSDLAQI